MKINKTIADEPRFTDKEKLVMWAMCEYPDLKDIEISEKIGMGGRTFSSIKARLAGNNLFSSLMFPDFGAIGCEFLTVSYGEFNSQASLKVMKKALKRINECNAVIHVYSNGREFVILSASKNITVFNKIMWEVFSDLKEIDFLRSVRHVHFPLEMTNYKFFEYSGIIKSKFAVSPGYEAGRMKKVSKKRLTKREKELLYAILKMPGAKNRDISSASGIKEDSVGRIKRNLIKSGILNIRKIPDTDIFNFEILAFMHVKYNRGQHLEEIEKRDEEPEILNIKSEADYVSVSLFKNYTQYSDYYFRNLEYLLKEDLIDKNPEVLLFPIIHLKSVKDFGFKDILKIQFY